MLGANVYDFLQTPSKKTTAAKTSHFLPKPPMLACLCSQTPKTNICSPDFVARVPRPPKERLLSTVCCFGSLAKLPKERLLSGFCCQSPKAAQRTSATLILLSGPSNTVCWLESVARLRKRTSAVWILLPDSQGPQNNTPLILLFQASSPQKRQLPVFRGPLAKKKQHANHELRGRHSLRFAPGCPRPCRRPRPGA